VQLTFAHTHKIYFSGPLIRRVERQPDGQKPAKDEGWVEVWAQLGGTTLSVWDMRAVEQASKEGREVPPAYINITDAVSSPCFLRVFRQTQYFLFLQFVKVLGSVTVPGNGSAGPRRYANVLTLNTAGSNLLLFSCPDATSLVSWASSLRLSAWEKSRLEEIYTAHLIRITLNDGGLHASFKPESSLTMPHTGRRTPTPLYPGKMEGWVRIRVAGQTDWKRLWMVCTAGASDNASLNSNASPTAPRKKRLSIFGSAKEKEPPRPTLALFSTQKPKDRKRPVLTINTVKQAFAVYPERPELISRSTLMKLEGLLGEEDAAESMKNREAWVLVMPELEGGNTQASEMLKWLIGQPAITAAGVC
jgi:CCR4-NOT transcriptional complex subunit CAF120